MVEEISSENNTKKLLLEGNGQTAAPQPRPVRHAPKKPADIVVENATEKRYLWTARAFAVIFAVSLCCNLILTYVIFTSIPLYRVEPYLFTFADKGEQIYQIEPVENIRDYKYLTEIMVREYVLLRNSFVADVEEMERRWGPKGVMQEQTSNKAYMRFKEDADKIIEQIRQYGVRRDVHIVSATEVGTAASKQGVETWWQVEFRTDDMAPTFEAPRKNTWVANLKIRYRAKQVKFGERLKNPLGFTVEEYKSTKR